jgi:hypothetical protein
MKKEINFMKLIYRVLWIAAVIFGGLSAVKIALSIMERDGKNYIEP